MTDTELRARLAAVLPHVTGCTRPACRHCQPTLDALLRTSLLRARP